jgi:uncharacterized delta-60 repeat protein
MFSLKGISLRDLFRVAGLVYLPIAAHAAPGDVDLTFDAGLSYGSSVEAIGVQADGKILMGNERLFPNGGKDPFYMATASLKERRLDLSHHEAMRPQITDGSSLVHGWFHPDGPVPSPAAVARFSREGNMDPNFNVDHLGRDVGLLPWRDGKIFSISSFVRPGESTARGLLQLLKADGSLDPSFSVPDIDRDLFSVGVQRDGKIIIIGQFTSVNGTAKPGIARLHADGTLDTTFAPVLENRPLGLVILPDGDILLSNISTTVNGSHRQRTVRLSSAGAVDSSFSLITNDRIGSMAVQTDGSIVITGTFSTVNESPRSRLARVTSSGALDTTFRSLSFSNGSFYSMAMQPDGGIMLSGSYSSIGGVERPNLTRLQNGTGTSSFVQVDAGTVRWMRSGALPEVRDVICEVFSTAAGAWIPLGPATRITGGWEISGSLPVSGTVRTRALQAGTGSGLIEGLHVLGGALPDLVMRDGADGAIVAGTTVDAGRVLVEYPGARKFGIGNQGEGILGGLNITISGPAAADFKIIGFTPKVLAPGDSLPFEVSFTPSAVGGRTATLTVSSDDPDLPFWSVTLSGEGTNRMDPVINSAADVPLRTPAFSGAGKTFGSLTLGFAPAPGTILTVLERTDNNPIESVFDDLPDGGLVSATFGGQTYVFLAGYQGGSGNDLTLTLSSAGTPALLNHPDFTGEITALAVRPDRSMLIGGNLLIPGNTKNRYLLMLRPDGTLVENFTPRFSTTSSLDFSKILPYPDGRFLVFGRFDSVNEEACRNVVRFNADGTVDPTFQIGEFPYLIDLDLMPDGKLLARVSANAGAYITRYESNGDPDAGFTPSRTGITNFLRLRDGKILITGDFGQSNGYHRLLRLEADGSPDTSFNPPGIEYYSLGQMMEQRDGRVLVITSPGTNGRSLRRFNADGTLDDTFQPYFGSSRTFNSFIEQADGKLIVGGNFSQFDGFQLRGLVRLFPDGTRDASFSGSASQINSLAMLADGEIFASGGGIGGVSTIRLCRLLNNSGSFSAEIPQTGMIRLSATGAVPEPSWVNFSVLPSGGGWTPPVSASLTAEGWEVSGQTLPDSGIIRWMVRPSGWSRSSSLPDGFSNFGSAAPVVGMSGPDGVVLPDGSGVVEFGKMFPGRSRVLPITIRNSGDGVWLPGEATITGSGAERFSILESPLRGVLPGEAATFLVGFTPEGAVGYSASLSVSGNQTTGDPYVVQLSGTGSMTLDPLFHSAGDVQIAAFSFNTESLSFGTLQLGFTPTAGTQLRVINNTGTTLISGVFTDLADGSVIQATYEGVTYDFLVGYRAGNGNDLVLAFRGPGVPLAGHSTQVTGSVSMALPLDDGGALIGGLFTQVNGVPRAGIAKLDTVGGTVPGFSPSASGATSAAVALPGGDHLLAGLLFARTPGTDMNDVARLTADGIMKPLARANNTIQTMAVQKDGGILIGGSFTSVNGVSRSGLARLHPSGALDRSFSASSGNNVSAILVQQDGRILVAAPSYTHLSRLLPTGAVDPSFTSPFANNFSSAPISAMVSLPDGRIIIGGTFDRVGSVLCAYLARLHPDGSLDTSFRPRLDARVRTLALQADGSIIAGGDFTEVNDVARNRLVRISSDGSLDVTFDPNAGDRVSSVALAKDGRLLVCGFGLSTLSGAPSSNFEVLANQPAISSLQISPNKVTWLRGGTAPEAVSATFEIRGAGDAGWRVLGEGVRVAGGWELATGGVPAGHLVRARARITAGNLGYEATEEPVGTGSLAAYLAVSVDSGEIDFGTLPIASAGQTRVRITNLGTAPLVVSPPVVEGPQAADFMVIDPTAITLPVGGHAVVAIRFTPSAAGVRNAVLRLSSNDPAGDRLIPLRGEGGGFTPYFANADEVPLSYAELPAGPPVFGGLRLGFAPLPGTILTAVDVGGTSPVSGTFGGLADQSFITAGFGGKDYRFLVDYRGGDGNDLVFILDGPGVAEATFAPGPSSRPNSIAVQDDGKILISGSFTTVGGASMGNLVRLLPDGTPDTTFPVTGTAAESMAVQLDGKILVAADVTGGGHQRLKLARLNRDGTIDTTFQANITGTVARICVLRNGKILIGGPITRVDGQTRTGVALLNTNGSLDASFTANLTGASQTLYAMAEQADGKLLLGGWYTHVGGQPRTYLSRVSATGAVDTTFNVQMTSQAGGVSSIAVQPDGKIVIGGYITGIGGAVRNNIARLNPDGSIDAAFAADADQPSTCIRIQADGKIMVSGLFTRMNGVKKNAIARLHADGTLDTTFNVMPMHTYPSVYAMVMPPDGGLLIGGTFTGVGNRGGANFAKLGKDELVSEVEAIGGAKVRWTTGGALTEMHSTTFEVSTNGGTSWTLLGEGARVAGGWGLQGISLPPSGLLRARGSQILTSRVTASQTIEVAPFTRRDFTVLEAWRDEHFDDAFDSSVDLVDSDHDGLKNLVEFALGLSPHADSSGMLPSWTRSGGHYVMSFTRPTGVTGITYSAEWSETMREDDWHLAEDLSVGDAKSFRVPVGTEERKFFRLKVANP